VTDREVRTADVAAGQGHRAVPWSRDGGGRRRRRRDETQMVPDAQFRSYYGRPVVKPVPWENDVPAYLFLGGVAAGSSLLAAGADLTGAPALRRTGRLGALAALLGSTYFLVHDLGRPERFHHMLRVIKPTSPMSVGSWLLATYGGPVAAAAAAELLPYAPRRVRAGRPGRLLAAAARPSGVAAAGVAPMVASYTAVLLAHTSTPTWAESYPELPFVFVGSAAAAASGVGLLGAPVAQSGAARRLAVLGSALELAAEVRMERRLGMLAEPLHTGVAGRYLRASRALEAGGALLALASRRSRPLSALAGVALAAGSACLRFGVFEAGLASARDPKYTVVPQRRRLQEGRPVRFGTPEGQPGAREPRD
jgi:formate-dependent nitrite reductase membrane component NrfD